MLQMTKSSVARIVDNPSGAETSEIFKQNAGMRTTMWLSFSSEIMSVELTDYADRHLLTFFNSKELEEYDLVVKESL